MDHHLPADVRRKLREARAWLRARDARLADCVEAFELRAGPGVILARPEAADGGAGPGRREAGGRESAGSILVNPAAIRDLPLDVVAGALLGSILAAPLETCGGREGRAELWRRAERVRRTLQLT